MRLSKLAERTKAAGYRQMVSGALHNVTQLFLPPKGGAERRLKPKNPD
jgi:hypothetical protein